MGAPDEPAERCWVLGLPLAAPRSTALATLSLALYLALSMARDLSLYDSGELALAAVQLGLAHPPGQPLHTLLGFALSHLPGVAPLVGVNLLSALPTALTLLPATSVAERLLGAATHARRRRLSAALPWFIATLALHPALWECATRVEVYALATLLAVWSAGLFAALRDLPDVRRCRRQLAALGLGLGLCASVNPVIALCTALALAPGIAGRLRGAVSWGAGLGMLVLGGLAGLVPYAYLPAVANRTGVLVWGAPHDLESYLRYVLLRDYAHNQGIAAAAFGAHLLDWCSWALRHGLAPLFALGLVGHARGARALGRAGAALCVALPLAFIATNVVWHVDIPDYAGYMAPALWLMAGGAAATALAGVGATPAASAVSAALIAILVASALGSEPNPTARTRHVDRLARTLGTRVLGEAPARAIVIAETDAIAGALMYLQGAERARPDVAVIVHGLASSSWHWDQLFTAHPTLHRMPLRGPGGRSGRLRRLLEANPERPVLFERLATSQELGVQACPGGLYLKSGPACARATRQDPAIAPMFERQLAQLQPGSPSAAGAIAQLTYQLGEALWRLDHATAAHAILLSGVPRSERPITPSMDLARAPAPPPGAAGPRFSAAAALGDPARNLFLAGAIVGAAGDGRAARAYLEAAARGGLPEAHNLLR